MAGSAARSLKSRKNLANQQQTPVSQMSQLTQLAEQESRPRPQTSYGTRRSQTSLVSSSTINKEYEHTDNLYKNMETQIATVEDETDALLRELQQWRMQHSKTLEGIKSQIPSPTKQTDVSSKLLHAS